MFSFEFVAFDPSKPNILVTRDGANVTVTYYNAHSLPQKVERQVNLDTATIVETKTDIPGNSTVTTLKPSDAEPPGLFSFWLGTQWQYTLNQVFFKLQDAMAVGQRSRLPSSVSQLWNDLVVTKGRYSDSQFVNTELLVQKGPNLMPFVQIKKDFSDLFLREQLLGDARLNPLSYKLDLKSLEVATFGRGGVETYSVQSDLVSWRKAIGEMWVMADRAVQYGNGSNHPNVPWLSGIRDHLAVLYYRNFQRIAPYRPVVEPYVDPAALKKSRAKKAKR